MNKITFVSIPSPLLENFMAAYTNSINLYAEFMSPNKKDKEVRPRWEYSHKLLAVTVKAIFNYVKFLEQVAGNNDSKYKAVQVPQELLETLYSSIEKSKIMRDKYFASRSNKKSTLEAYVDVQEYESQAMRDLFIYLKYTANIVPRFNDDFHSNITLNYDEFFK